MSADHDIDSWLAAKGFGLTQARQQARALLEAEKLTHPGKTRISTQKVPRISALFASHFYLCCADPGCERQARESGRAVVRCEPKSCCEHCGGSDNRRAEARWLEACRRHQVTKLVVVGGSPSVREELQATLGKSIALRTIDGTERRPSDRAQRDLDWADLVLVWGASELHHKVSTQYTQASPALRKKVVLVAKRGVAALLAAAVEHLERRG